MDDPVVDSLTAEEQQGAAELMASVDFRKLGGGEAAGDRGPSGQRDEVDQSTLLSTVHVGSTLLPANGRDRLSDLEINPLMVLAEGEGVRAVDVRPVRRSGAT